MIIDGVATAGKPAAISVRKPMFLQKERWQVIQKARRKGTSFQASGQKLGIHRVSIKKYMDAEVPQLDNPGWFPQRRHLITSQPNRVTFTLNFDTPIAQFLDTLDILYERSPSASVHTLSCVSWRGGRDRMERVGSARRRGELDVRDDRPDAGTPGYV